MESKLAGIYTLHVCADTTILVAEMIRVSALLRLRLRHKPARKSTNVNVKKNNTLGFSPRDVRDVVYVARTIIISIRNADCVS